MNYIRHLNAAMVRFTEDDRLRPSHISLYLALFQLWNANRFRNPLSISRGEVMRVSKIGSVATYHRCIKHLHEYGYLEYLPSFNPLVGSQVNLFTFETASVQVTEQPRTKNGTGSVQVVKPYINSINKRNKNKGEKGSGTPFTPPSIEEIILFLKETAAGRNDGSAAAGQGNEQEARRFHNYYSANGWRVGQNEMQNWRAAAENWLLKAPAFNGREKHTGRGGAPSGGYLNANQHKDYDEPL